MKKTAGFTMLELIIAMTIIAILAGISVYLPTQLLPAARNTERTNDAASIARRLEQAYTAKETGEPAYPSTTKLLSDISGATGTVLRLKSDAFKAPGSSTSNVVAASSNSTSTPKGAGSPVLNEYVYQPLTSTGSLCTGTAVCVRFYLYYRLESSLSIIKIKSIRQQ